MAAGAFQRSGSSVSILSSTNLAGLSTMQIGGLAVMEIANLSTTTAATFYITAAGQTTGQAAATTDRVIPPDYVLYENIPLGASYVSALAVTGPGPTIVFTPGNWT